jgi:hypothetical protein
MEHLFTVILVGLTSVGGYVIGVKGLGLSKHGLRAALHKTLECVGAMLVFFLVNLVVAMISILTARSLTGGFVSLYRASDIALLVLSFLQALTFQGWLEASRQRDGAGR